MFYNPYARLYLAKQAAAANPAANPRTLASMKEALARFGARVRSLLARAGRGIRTGVTYPFTLAERGLERALAAAPVLTTTGLAAGAIGLGTRLGKAASFDELALLDAMIKQAAIEEMLMKEAALNELLEAAALEELLYGGYDPYVDFVDPYDFYDIW